MGLFDKSKNSHQPGSFWNRFTKSHRTQEQKSNGNNSTSNPILLRSENKHQVQPQIKIFGESKRENFRLSLESFHTNFFNFSDRTDHINQVNYIGSVHFDSRLRTSKFQCEQLKKKLATIRLECNKFIDQHRDLTEIKDHFVTFQSDIRMLKRKEKATPEIQLRLSLIDEENSVMRDQIEKLKNKISNFDSETNSQCINKRIEQLESDNHKLTQIILQNRREHENFSLDVGNQLIETFISQQAIYEEFQRLHQRLLSVERQNQIMADLIHFHCQISAKSINSRPLTNSDSSRGLPSMHTSSEAVSLSHSPLSSDREAEKVNTISEQWEEPINFDRKDKDYYKIDFTTNHEFLTTSPMTDLSVGSICSTQEKNDQIIVPEYILKEKHDIMNDSVFPLDSHCTYFQYDTISSDIHNHFQKDDGYYSTSHDGTMNINESMTIIDSTFKAVTVFLDKKERYFILARHLQKSHGKSKRLFTVFTFVVNYSVDLETKLHNGKLRYRQQKQRECHQSELEEEQQVFSDTELYGTRFCIDSDFEEDELPSLFMNNKILPFKKSLNYGYPNKSIKNDPKQISPLPPLIEHVHERERKIEIRSKKSRIVPPRVRPKSVNVCTTAPEKSNNAKILKEKLDFQKSETLTKISNQYVNKGRDKSRNSYFYKKPSNGILNPKSNKLKILEIPKNNTTSKLSRIPITNSEVTKPPIPPRRKYMDKELTSSDYVSGAQVPVSQEDIQNIKTKISRNYSDDESKRRLTRNNSSLIEEYFIEDDCDGKSIKHINELEDYFDKEFISELENYQLPKSSMNILVLKHFK